MNKREFLSLSGAAALLAACSSPLRREPEKPIEPPAPVPAPAPVVQPVLPRPKPKIGLALGGGAARGFVHIGVIKALETQGIQPDIVVGTSAGSVVGALYASGIGAFDLQQLAFKLDESKFADWVFFERGFLKGEALESFINQQVGNRPIEALRYKFAAVATDLANGEPAVFTSGNVGTAVRASSALPEIFAPVNIRGRDYVDGGLASPVPARAARQLGADVVIAVDISGRPSGKKNPGSIDMLLDTIAIMGNTIAGYELREADVVIRPDILGLPKSSFELRHEAILRGERAGFAAITRIREKIAAFGAK